MFAEFDDQGWVQGTYNLKRPAKDHIDALLETLKGLYDRHSTRGLSLVVYIHGWHHNAEATDGNVRALRALLRDIALIEGENGHRVVGIYVGWRGESVRVPGLSALTFWTRKDTAERIAQGSVRELFAKLDYFRDLRREGATGTVRMLTIAHSFGGLVGFAALSSDFLRAAARRAPGRWLPRLGDLVVIVNPAFEGSRYEPLMIAGQRLGELKTDQLPVVIVATSEADTATRVWFPFGRFFSTLFKRHRGEEGRANRRTVGHNERYTTHQLEVCDEKKDEKEKKECRQACALPGVLTLETHETDARRTHIRGELEHMKLFAAQGFGKEQYLCDALSLTATDRWYPVHNPFWVVHTTGKVMTNHNDIFNPNFVAFIRQMYLAVIVATDKPAQ